jgi:hypothetical protein
MPFAAPECDLRDNSTIGWIEDEQLPQPPEKREGDMPMRLPPEPGTIEFRADGSVTVAGHRIRLKSVYDALATKKDGNITLADLAHQFQTIERPLLARVCSYIARHFFAVSEHVKIEEQEFSRLSMQATHISLDDLRRRIHK